MLLSWNNNNNDNLTKNMQLRTLAKALLTKYFWILTVSLDRLILGMFFVCKFDRSGLQLQNFYIIYLSIVGHVGPSVRGQRVSRSMLNNKNCVSSPMMFNVHNSAFGYKFNSLAV